MRKGIVLSLVAVLLGVGVTTYAGPISGTISATLTITESSALTGDVACTVTSAPCILFGASNIKLRLNGFTITGQVPVPGCGRDGSTSEEDGIDTGGQSHVEIEGPGRVTLFRNHGIHVSGGARNKVDRVTVSANCQIGIALDASQSDVENNTAVRNGSVSSDPAGGIRVGGSNNRVWRNEVAGNGVRFPVRVTADQLVTDFGIGVFGTQNLIEENSASGNIPHGMVLFAGATGNLLIGNTALGNPPVQMSLLMNFGFPDTPLGDILDSNAVSENAYTDNLCEVGLEGAAGACPNLPPFAGHKNAR